MPIITSSGMPAAVAEVVGLDCLGLPKTRRTTAAARDARCAALQVPLDLLRRVLELAWWVSAVVVRGDHPRSRVDPRPVDCA